MKLALRACLALIMLGVSLTAAAAAWPVASLPPPPRFPSAESRSLRAAARGRGGRTVAPARPRARQR